MWMIYAIFSSFFAGMTAILAKCGVRKTDSTVATSHGMDDGICYKKTIETQRNREERCVVFHSFSFSTEDYHKDRDRGTTALIFTRNARQKSW